MPPQTRRTLTTFLAACLLLAGLATGASAAPPEVVEHDAGRFYGNLEQGILLFTGDEVTNICSGVAEPVVPARVFQRRDGSTDLRARADGMAIFLYHSPLGAPEFIDATCQAMFDGDPSTNPVDPFASGTARFREDITVHPNGYEEHVNGVNGSATSPDGTRWRVRTWADFAIDDGMLVGDPAEFQGLSLHQLGR